MAGGGVRFSELERQFKLCGQLTERKREGREGTAVPAAGGFILSELAKPFKLFLSAYRT